MLWITEGPETFLDSIRGTIACNAPPELDPLCVPDDARLAEAVLQCGSPEVTIDRGYSHVRFIHFPAGLHARFNAIPSDVDIVRCVQGRVGFRFSAGLGTDPASLPGADQRPFAALHTPAR